MGKYDEKLKKLKALQKYFEEKLHEKIAKIFELWKHAKASDVERFDAEDFHRALHTLAGSSASFGFVNLGKKAKQLELIILEFCSDIEKKNALTTFEKIEEELAELKLISEAGPDQEESEFKSIIPRKPEKAQSALVYLLEDDDPLAQEAASQIRQFGYELEIFSTCKELIETCSSKLPDVFIIDINLPEAPDAGIKAINELSKNNKLQSPVVFISGHDSWSNRLQALRAGGSAFVIKPISFHDLVERLDDLTGRKSKEKYRVLIVDDSREVGEHYSTVLQLANMETKLLEHPFKLLEILPEFRPDIILMDLYMPRCSGIEAASVIRQSPAFTSIPIVYLSTEHDFAEQLEAMQVGGDDFLKKPIKDEHLVSAVNIRAKRFRELSALMNKDSLTGLVNHMNLKLALDREVSMASRNQAIFCFVMIDIDNFKSINDNYGHPEGDKVIKTLSRLFEFRLRKGDIASRYGGEEFAIILPETSSGEAFKVIQSLRARFSQIKFGYNGENYSVTFSAGISSHPECKSVEELISVADKALYSAKHKGRNQVVVAVD